MKGLIFTELVSFMEQNAGVVMTEDIIEEAQLPNGAAFTSIGNYPSDYAVRLVKAASKLTGVPQYELCGEFGEYLFGRFVVLYPGIVGVYKDADALLRHVGTHIHEEVRLLHPNSTPPEVSASRNEEALVIEYSSHRPMAHIAIGLVRGCLAHFGDRRRVIQSEADTPFKASLKVMP